ncbi:pleckstrin homology domain-containing family G member 7 isoform X2 [Brienomyrus brachyistius]|uniref:pleckstrin homology domain-containing family G member 7 isoform X2 n=1 Tax=Brienomyrus brachyistius TaxID=42636 RepID=UPI0020B1D804|nr:pleckstrin homology domain-containing family G member 7 isoform X2 [Brienomyrus brachyistius]
MSSEEHTTTVCENGAILEETLDGSYTEGYSGEDGVTERSVAQTQTDLLLLEDKETQTSAPIVMWKQDQDEKVTPFLQFNRQAAARISTSPTLRRMRSSVRRPVKAIQDHTKGNGTLEDSVTCESPVPGNAFSPQYKHGFPLPEPGSCPEQGVRPNDEQDNQPAVSPMESTNRSGRCHTLDNSLIQHRKTTCSVTEPVCGTPEVEEHLNQAKDPSPERLEERRRSSVVISLPGLDVSPGDLFVSNGAAGILSSTISDTKKSKWPFTRRVLAKGKEGSVSDVMKHLSTMQVEDWRDTELQTYKDCSLEGFLKIHGCKDKLEGGDQDHRREEAVWELFTSECVYFLDQLMVLKQVFLVSLANLQENDCLQDVDPWKLFANLNELCLVSFGFLTSFLRVIKQSWDIPVRDASPELADLLIKGFKDSICHCQQKYCLNYSTTTFYVDSLKHREDFKAYVKWCESHPECRRLRLKDFQVAPLQRLTRYPLLLRNICKRSSSEEQSRAVEAVVEIVDRSIQELEGKVKWLDNYHNIQRLKECLVWPQVWERNKRGFVPENLKHLLKVATLDNLITHRNMLFEGKVSLVEQPKVREVHLFLFEEFLLITKVKRNKKHQRPTGLDSNPMRPALSQELQDGCTFMVLDQPISLDRLQLRNVDQLNATASGLPNTFVILHLNRYQQCVGVYILQAGSETLKKCWMSEIEGAVAALQRQDSQQPRVRYSAQWLESSQI